MQTRLEFLETVLPPEGRYCALGLRNKRPDQTFHDTLGSLSDRLEELSTAGVDAYYALAAFGPEDHRTQDNAVALKSFFFDLDCGPGKAYTDQTSALAALRTQVRALKLPRPNCVSSGRGIHVYWVMEQAVPRVEWKRVADWFKKACQLTGFVMDYAVPADTARVLRAPFTNNYKGDAPLPVEVLHTAPAIPLAVFKERLGFMDMPAWTTQGSVEDDPVMKSLLRNTQSRFKKIILLQEGGCAQLNAILTEQGTIPEPLWRAGLSIANACVDGAKAIHMLSKHHPGYTHAATVSKAMGTKGPYTCESFESLNPEGCKGCKHKGRVKSPIVLGHEIAAATPEDVVVPEVLLDLEVPEVYVIPEYPHPFFRGKNGGVYLKGEEKKNEAGEEAGVEDDEVVYPHDFYLVQLVSDPSEGMSGLFRLHLPKEAVKDFIVAFTAITTKEKFRDAITQRGMMVLGRQVDRLMFYVSRAVSDMQTKNQADKARSSFGWADHYTKFIVGNREIGENGVKHSPPAGPILSEVGRFIKKGSLEEWKKIPQFYANPRHKNQELHAFVMFCGFGSVLVEFMGVPACAINLVSTGSGVGKTSMQRVVNSIFGHSDDLMLTANDTMNSRFHFMGVLNNLATCVDETTTETNEVAAKFLYALTQSRGKNRMKGSENQLRTNTTAWRSICILSGNASMRTKLAAFNSAPDGGLARFMEFEVLRDPLVPKTVADAVFVDVLNDNHGVAGEVFIQHIMKSQVEVRRMCVETRDHISEAIGATGEHRYWVSTLACAFVAAHYLEVLGIWPVSMKPIYQWAIRNIRLQASGFTAAKQPPDSAIGMFLQDHINDTLIINGVPSIHNVPNVPTVYPRNRLLVRYEPDTCHLYISVSHLKEFCAKRQFMYDSVVHALERRKVVLGSGLRRIGKGTAIALATNVLVLDNSKGDVFDVDTFSVDGEQAAATV